MTEILKILIVEDNPGDYVLLRETIIGEGNSPAHELINAPTLGEAKSFLEKEKYDVKNPTLNCFIFWSKKSLKKHRNQDLKVENFLKPFCFPFVFKKLFGFERLT